MIPRMYKLTLVVHGSLLVPKDDLSVVSLEASNPTTNSSLEIIIITNDTKTQYIRGVWHCETHHIVERVHVEFQHTMIVYVAHEY